MAYTRLKELESFRNNSPCVFCKQTRSDELLYGKIYQFGEIITHYFCMLFSSQMEQNGKDEEGILGFLPADIKKELSRGQKLVCVYCHLDGATINCCNRVCKKRYHFPCAVDNGALHQFFGQFRSFCFNHRRSQVIPSAQLRAIEKFVCIMCQEEVKSMSSRSTIWAPCCKTTWFHRLCVQRMAVSAGYFFKCPNCNNKDKFRNEMLECGIYIPDQDASWEMEPNAFSELNERHNQCDAEICKCPRGRTHSATEGVWEIALCSLCGSQGTHMRCGKEKIDKKGQWSCAFCASVVNKMQPNASNNPGPSVSTGSRGVRNRRARRKRHASPAETKESPAEKAIAAEATPEDSNLATDDTSASTRCLYANGGRTIHVVKVDKNPHADKVVEIGGVNVMSQVIALESSDEDEDTSSQNTPVLTRRPNFTSTNHCRSPLPNARRTNPSLTTEKPTLVIDLLDSDEENASLDDDDDVVFVGNEVPKTTSPDDKDQSPAMIRIIQNDNVVVLSPAEIIKNETMKQTAKTDTTNVITSSNNGSSNVMWQSVPRHKSMVHSVQQSLTQANAGRDKNFNHFSEANRSAPMVREPRWMPIVISNGIASVNKPLTNGCDAVSEIINLDC